MLNIFIAFSICFFYNNKKFSKKIYLKCTGLTGLTYKFVINLIAINYLYLIINRHFSIIIFLLKYLFLIYKSQNYIFINFKNWKI